MINFSQIKEMYFVGIGGIGMSALAQYFHKKGVMVSGFDDNKTDLTKKLKREGIKIEYSFNGSQLSPNNSTLIIYTPAIKFSHKVLRYFIINDFKIFKRAEILGYISKNVKTLAVAGTHGKTTTCSMLTHMLEYNNLHCTSFIGGIDKNFNNNFINNKDDLIVVEADEYDKSFLYLSPDIAVITSIDSDHLDVYKKFKNLKETFVSFCNNVKDNGILVSNKKLGIESNITYSIKSNATYWASNFKLQKNGFYKFDIHHKEDVLSGVQISVFGRYNISNFLAALSLANHCGLSLHQCVDSMKCYKGVERRFEVHINTENCVLIDDYAHHPTEISKVISAAKEAFKSKKIMCVFQPHLYSRTKDYAFEFGQALSLADELIIVDIYPAREKPIKGVNAALLLENASNKFKINCSKSQLLENIKLSKAEVYLILGAGDISEMVSPVKEILKNKLKAA